MEEVKKKKKSTNATKKTNKTVSKKTTSPKKTNSKKVLKPSEKNVTKAKAQTKQKKAVEKKPKKVVETIQRVEPKEIKNTRINKESKEYTNLYIYGILIASFLVLSNSILNIKITINSFGIPLSILTYPLVLLFGLIIYKRYGILETVEAIIAAITCQLLLLLLRWLIFGFPEASVFIASTMSYILCQTLCIALYNVSKKYNIKSYIYVFGLFMAVLVIDSFCFSGILNMFDIVVYEKGSWLVIGFLKAIMSVLCTYVFIKE